MLTRIALRQLMTHAASAGSLKDVYDAALRGVQEALNIERAALLVIDAGGTMRFVASSALSDEYRRAIDGHSPWSITDTNATPVLVADVELEPSLSVFVPVFRQEAIRALAFVPLQFGTRLLGKFTLCYREPHAFSETEVAVAEQIADHVAFALEHHRLAVALDDRLLAERNLREQAERDAAQREVNERRLDLALASGHMGAWEWDINSDVVTWSSELEVIHGLEPGTFERTLEAYRRDVHPADADRVSAAIAGALEAPDTRYDIEYRIVRPDGTIRWLGATGRVIVDSNGRPSRMLGICRDVTERKRAQEASAFVANASRVLATTLAPEPIIENLARLVVPSLADWCIVQVTDAEGRLHPVEITHRDSSQTARMWELFRHWPSSPDRPFSAASVASSGRPLLVPRITDDILRGRVGVGFAQALQEMRLHSAMTVPLQVRGRTLGALTLMSAESERLYDNADLRFAEEIASWAAITIDNAQLYRQAEEARLAAETARGQLEALATVSDQIAVSLDPDEALRELAARVVPAFADYCVTYAAGERVIRPLGCAHRDRERVPLVEALVNGDRVSIDDREGPGMVIRIGEPCLRTDAAPDTAATQPNDVAVGDLRAKLDARSMMTVPLKARGRTLGAIVFAATSDSGRQFVDADLKIAMDLASRAALLVDNARLYAEACTAVRSRDEMVAFVSHDLRNPLASISAATATLQLEQTGANAENIDSITRASTEMQRLVQDLLDVSTIEAGRLSISREQVDLRDLIGELQAILAPQAKARNVRIETRLAEDLPPVTVDRHRILQVLLNLIVNALKFGTPDSLVTLGAEPQENSVRIWVEDAGAGIGPEHLPRVFDRFWRADRRAGAGLGLAVAKGIVEAHGGRIGVTSQLGIGSTFFFTLPLHAMTDVSSAREVPVDDGRSVPPPRPGQRVLLVDDDRQVVQSLVRLVGSFGHRVEVAFSGESALQIAERFQPQIVLMDVSLPGLSGYDTAREMRSQPWAQGVRIVAMTGWAREGDRSRALHSGFDVHLTKPVGVDRLEAVLNASLAPHKASQAF
jgi:PAS domain S-box-containing protein